MQTEVLQAMQERRSCRAYLPQQVGAEELEAVLTAGTWAPTGMGAQSPVIVAVQDKATRDQLSRMNADVMGSSGDPFYGAPVVIVVLENLDEAACPGYDGPLVMGNLMNAAYALGVDSCWIHRAREMFETDEGKELLAKWGLKGNYRGVGNCILGYHDGAFPEAKPRREGTVVRVR